MVLTNDEQQRLTQRLNGVSDIGGLTRVAEVAGITTRVIQKAQSGGNVRVETIESIMNALKAVENERKTKLNRVKKALA